MNRSLILIAIGVVGFTMGASWFAEAKRPRGVKSAPGTTEICKTDADCTVVPDDCCPCNEGGAQRAIPVKQKDAYEKQRHRRCAGALCAEMISQHPSCSQRATCAAGICALGGTPGKTAP